MEQNLNTMAARHKAVDAFYRLKSLKKAAKEVDRLVSFVVRWVSRHKKGLGMGDLPRAGRPSFLLKSEEAIDVIMSCMLDRQGPAGTSKGGIC